ncbi:unnamed protein product [Moneuplotes crassus]|uniref:Mitochondrial cardiolipin hydrolase n=1 Tax=Euplotes crassus TaxID=5936 RepID=A0AAD1X5T7_EUPCR|nr:unnamed protein product [Moneuplotes crassus]
MQLKIGGSNKPSLPNFTQTYHFSNFQKAFASIPSNIPYKLISNLLNHLSLNSPIYGPKFSKIPRHLNFPKTSFLKSTPFFLQISLKSLTIIYLQMWGNPTGRISLTMDEYLLEQYPGGMIQHLDSIFAHDQNQEVMPEVNELARELSQEHRDLVPEHREHMALDHDFDMNILESVIDEVEAEEKADKDRDPAEVVGTEVIPREENKEEQIYQSFEVKKIEVQQRYKEVTQNWIIEPHRLDLTDDNIKEMTETFDKACYQQEQGTEFISLLHSVLTGTPNFSSDKICKLTLKLHESCIKKQLGTDRDKMASTHLEELISFPSKESFAKLEGYLYSAKEEVKICVYWFSSPRLWGVIKTLLYKGITVKLVTDHDSGDNFKKEGFTQEELQEIAPKFTHKKLPIPRGIRMHHKFVIIDNNIVLNGSFNWTNMAETRNFENIVAHTSKHLIKEFTIEFNKIWNGGVEYPNEFNYAKP